MPKCKYPYRLDKSTPDPVVPLFNYNGESWYDYMSSCCIDTLNWMLMIKENIDNNKNTITLQSDTVLRYTGGGIYYDAFHTYEYCMCAYLSIVNAHNTLIIVSNHMITVWYHAYTKSLNGINIVYVKDFNWTRNGDDEFFDKIINADLLLISSYAFVQTFNPPKMAPAYKQRVLSAIRSKHYQNLFISTYVQSNLINRVDVTYKWIIVTRKEFPGRKCITDVLNVIFPQQREMVYKNNFIIVPIVFRNHLLHRLAKLRLPNIHIRYNDKFLKLDSLQNIECEIKASTDSECCIYRQECDLKYTQQIRDDISIDEYVSAINSHIYYDDKVILCIDNPNDRQLIGNKMKLYRYTHIINESTITVNDINRFKRTSIRLLIIPYKVKFELGANLLCVKKLMILCHPEDKECYNYLMNYVRQNRYPTSWIQLNIPRLVSFHVINFV